MNKKGLKERYPDLLPAQRLEAWERDAGDCSTEHERNTRSFEGKGEGIEREFVAGHEENIRKRENKTEKQLREQDKENRKKAKKPKKLTEHESF